MKFLKFRGSTTQTLLLIGMLILVLFSGGSILNLSLNDLGYSSAFEGPKTKFAGVDYNNKRYTSSIGLMDTTLRFDPDKADDGKPDLIGEMTTMFVPRESISEVTKWIPTEWLARTQTLKNPQNKYSWNMTAGENLTRVFIMEEWVLKWYLSISAEGQGSWEIFGPVQDFHGEIPYIRPYDPFMAGQKKENIYTDTEIWFEIDITPTWYIEGQGTAHFAVAKITLTDWKSEVKDNEGKVKTSDTSMSFSPSSGQLYMYYALWGDQKAETYTAQSFYGRKLNPAYFRNKVFAHLDLNNFGVRSWSEYPAVRSKGDVMTVGFDVTVFVIGEWVVKDIADIDFDDFGRTTKTTSTGPSLMEVLQDPRFQGIFTLLVLGGICLFLLIFAPWVLFAIVGLFRSGRRR